VTRAGVFIALAALAGAALGPGVQPDTARASSPSARRAGARPARHLPTHARTRHGWRGSARRARRVLSLPSGAGLTRAAILARVLATPCQDAQLTPEPGNLPLVRAAVLCLINRERAQNGEQPLALDTRLQAAAEAHVGDMIGADYFDHISPSGSTPVDRVREAGYVPNSQVGYAIGENLAWGTLSLSTPQAIVSAWMASPGHLANILESQYRDTGIAIEPQVPAALADGASGATYAQEFGVVTY
jgi:uncharacterized protein YkwD